MQAQTSIPESVQAYIASNGVTRIPAGRYAYDGQELHSAVLYGRKARTMAELASLANRESVQ